MADETREIKTILSADASKLSSTFREIRAEAELVKLELKSIQATTGETVKMMEMSFESLRLRGVKESLQEIRKNIKDVVYDLRLLGTELSRTQSSKLGIKSKMSSEGIQDITLPLQLQESEQQESMILDEIRTKRELLNSLMAQANVLQQQQTNLTKGTSLAFSELKQEAGLIETPIKNAGEGATIFTQNVADAKDEIMTLVKGGHDLDAAFVGVKNTGQYTGEELKKAFSQVKDELKGISEVAPTEIIPAEEADRFTASVAKAKAEMMELVKSGRDLEASQAGVAAKGEYSGKVLGKAYREIRQEMTATAKEAEKLPKAVLSAEAGAKKFTTNVASAKSEIKELVTSGYDLSAALAGVSGTGKYSTQEMTEALRQLRTEMKDTGDETSKTARIMERIFAAALIGVALNALRNFINGLKEAVQKGVEFRQSLIDLKVSIENLQDRGSTEGFSDWIDFLDRLSNKFTQFTTKDIQGATAEIMDLARIAGMSTQQIQQLLISLSILATKERTSLSEAAEAYLTAVGSERTTSLRKYTEATDEVSLAQEALRRGIVQTIDEMDAQTKMITALAIVQERAFEVQDDSIEIQNDLSGQYNRQTNEVEKLYAAIGDKLLPTVIWLRQAWIELLSVFGSDEEQKQRQENQIKILTEATAQAREELMGKATTAGEWIKAAFGNIQETDEFINAFIEKINEIDPSIWEDTAEGIELVNDGLEKGVFRVEDYSDAIDDLIFKLSEIGIGLDEDIAKEGRKLADQLEEDTWKRNLKIQQDQEKFYFDLEKINRDFNRKISDANDDYREKERKSEEDFQEKLRKLREKFLLDLEDALRERDARQVLRLVREFNLRKNQLERERRQEQEDNRRQLENQLRDIEKQRQARLEERRLEYELAKKQEEEQYELQKKLRQEDHDDRMRELRNQADERAEQLVRAYANEYDITVGEAWRIKTELEKIFGPRGWIEGIYMYYIAMVNNVAAATQGAFNSVNSYQPPASINPPSNGQDDWWQRHPDLLPQNSQALQQNVESSVLQNIPVSALISSPLTQSKVLIEMLLSPDLESRIIDKSLDNVANIIFTKSRV